MKEEERWIRYLKEGKNEEFVLKQIYISNWQPILSLVLKLGGDQELAKDIFHDTLIIFYENIKNDKFNHASKIGTYLYGIAKLLVYKRIREDKKLSLVKKSFSDEQKVYIDDDFWVATSQQQEMLKEALSSLQDGCIKVLTYFYYQKLSMKQIARLMNFKNEQVAKNKKSKCLNYLKKKWKELSVRKQK